MASSAGASPTNEPEPQENMDALLDLDAEAVASGVEAGRRAAAARSTRDGFALGYSKGGELAVEIGGYDGFLSVWEELLAVQPDVVPARTRKAIGAMRALVDAFPRSEPAAAAMDFVELAQKIRGKYRQICVALPGTPPKLGPSGAEEMSF